MGGFFLSLQIVYIKSASSIKNNPRSMRSEKDIFSIASPPFLLGGANLLWKEGRPPLCSDFPEREFNISDDVVQDETDRTYCHCC